MLTTTSAAKCLSQPLQGSSCNITGLFPKGGMPGMGAMGAPPGPSAVLVERQVPTATAAPGGGAPPKISISPEQSSAIASARSCFCSATAPLQAAASSCVPSSCATATGGGEGFAKIVNGLCKGISGFSPITPPPVAAATAAPA
jgi:hypothetical protein